MKKGRIAAAFLKMNSGTPPGLDARIIKAKLFSGLRRGKPRLYTRVASRASLPSSASAATAAGVATTVTSSRTAAWAASTTATPAIAIAIATAAAAGTSFTRTFRTRGACLYRRDYSIHAVEVWLIVSIEIRAAFDHCRRRSLRSTVRR